jgi:hypothetical protein
MAQKVNVQKLSDLLQLGKVSQHGEINLGAPFNFYYVEKMKNYGSAVSEADKLAVKIFEKAREISFDDVLKNTIFNIELTGSENNEPVIKNLSEDSLAILIAAVYKEQSEIFAQIRGDKAIIKQYLDIDITQDMINGQDSDNDNHNDNDNNNKRTNVSEIDLTEKTINWEALGNLIVADWADPDYVIANFNKTTNILNQADESLWFHPKTIKLFLSAIFYNQNYGLSIANFFKTCGQEKAERILMNEQVVDFLLRSPQFFAGIYAEYYQYKLGVAKSMDYKLDSCQIAQHPDNEHNIQIKHNISKALDDKNLALNYMDQRTGGLLYDYLPDKLKTDTEVFHHALDSMKKYKIYSDFYSRLPENFLKVWDNMSAIIVSVLPCIGMLDTEKLKLLCRTWKDSKEATAYYLDCCELDKELKDSGKITHFYSMFEYLDDNVKNDVDLAAHFIVRYPSIYQIPLIRPDLKTHPDIMIAYLSNYNPDMKYIDESWIFSLKDEKKIQKIINCVPELLRSENCPHEWLENLDILKQTGKNILNYPITDKVWKKIGSDVEYCASLVKENEMRIYRFLPEPMRAQPLVLENFLDRIKTHSNDSYLKMYQKDYDAIPVSVWNNPAMALEIVKKVPNELTINALPVVHFNNPVFVKGLFEAIDAQLIPEKMIRFFPDAVSSFISTVSQKGELAKTFSKGMLNAQDSDNNNNRKDEPAVTKMKI